MAFQTYEQQPATAGYPPPGPGYYPNPQTVVPTWGQPPQPPQAPQPYQQFRPGPPNPPVQQRKWAGWIIGAVAVVALGVGVAQNSGSSGPKGYNDPVKLGASIGAQITEEQTDGSSIDVTCIHQSGTQFTCIGVWSDDTPNDTFTATVPADGSTWITSD